MLISFPLLSLIFALSSLAHPPASGESCGAACNDEEKDDLALLQSITRVKPAALKSAASFDSRSSWVVSFGRSGSSTLQSMIAQIGKDLVPGIEFTIFEPCHVDDIARSLHNCSQEMSLLLKCNFSAIENLAYWGGHWDGVDSCCDDVKYSPAIASGRCLSAKTRTFKTIYVHDLVKEVLPILKDTPELRIINNVRDPRGTYQSMKKRGWQLTGHMDPDELDLGFADYDFHYNVSIGEHGENPEYLRYICGSLVNASTVSHPRIHHVRFEDLLSKLHTAKHVISFLKLPWNSAAEKIAKENFPGLEPGSNWSIINHYPGTDYDVYTSHDGEADATGFVEWGPAELEVLSGAECQSALETWGYPAFSIQGESGAQASSRCFTALLLTAAASIGAMLALE